MKVSRKTEYALRCVWYLALRCERKTTIAEIAQATSVPRSFLAKILQKLVAADIVVSSRGVKGGFRLARSPADINLYDVYVVTEGPRAAARYCAVSRNTCGVHGFCAVHPFWQGARRTFEQMLREATARDAPPEFSLMLPGASSSG